MYINNILYYIRCKYTIYKMYHVLNIIVLYTRAYTHIIIHFVHLYTTRYTLSCQQYIMNEKCAMGC